MAAALSGRFVKMSMGSIERIVVAEIKFYLLSLAIAVLDAKQSRTVG
jgi:hypothetical protein